MGRGGGERERKPGPPLWIQQATRSHCRPLRLSFYLSIYISLYVYIYTPKNNKVDNPLSLLPLPNMNGL